MGGKQPDLSDYKLTTAKKQTKWDKPFAEIEVVVPRQALIYLIEPHCPRVSKKLAVLLIRRPGSHQRSW